MSFVPACSFVGDLGAPRTVLLLHGAFGSGQNLRGLARALEARTPGIRYGLVDLRGHGSSGSAPPPHTMDTAARDILGLARSLGRSPHAIIGHSLGGKVALACARTGELPIAQIWTLDSAPGIVPEEGLGEVPSVLRAVRSLKTPLESRELGVQRLRAAGLSPMLASWLGTSLRRGESGLEWALDVDVIEDLLNDYRTTDLWPLLERPREGAQVHLVAAARSRHWSSAERKRAQTLPESAKVTLHVLQNAGHWLHVDNLHGLVDLLAPLLSGG